MNDDRKFSICVAVFVIFLITAVYFIVRTGNAQDAVKAAEYSIDEETQEAKDMTDMITQPGTFSEDYLTRDERIVICLDPGHGGSDGGAQNGRYIEKEQTLELCLLIRGYLMEHNVEVIMTREEDVEITKNERVFIANENYADVLVSIHRNNFYGSSANGFEIWIGKADRDEDRRLAQILLDNIAQVQGTYIRGIETGSTTDRNEDYIVNRHSLMPSCLVEMGFISNKHDNELYNNHKEEYARLIAEGILTYLGVNQEKNDGKN